jgi:L-asparagine transporter-like permease
MAERWQEPDATPGSRDSQGDSRGLHRTLGLGEVTAGGVGIIIGAGIYVLIGTAAAHTGEMVWLAFVLTVCAAGVVAAFLLRSGGRSTAVKAPNPFRRCRASPKW